MPDVAVITRDRDYYPFPRYITQWRFMHTCNVRRSERVLQRTKKEGINALAASTCHNGRRREASALLQGSFQFLLQFAHELSTRRS